MLCVSLYTRSFFVVVGLLREIRISCQCQLSGNKVRERLFASQKAVCVARVDANDTNADDIRPTVDALKWN